MSRVPEALLLYGMSERYGGSNNPKIFSGHKWCLSVSLLFCDSPAKLAPRNDNRPERDKNADSDLARHNRTVEDQNAVASRIVSLVDDSQSMKSSGASLMATVAADPIPQ
ncbi:hypothetical protein QAD02_003566 [Eretmocerus hayati]|uniref:Uncharacterized protein n=1 Tax=Eretmocerus hayati TaxID=131215 RepID=A0ACC2NMI7_9HYME|nr:hypothetical protein QAD02_003566 [Eretmocerus hayati]